MADGMACVAGQTCGAGIQHYSSRHWQRTAAWLLALLYHEILYYTMQYHGILKDTGIYNAIPLYTNLYGIGTCF